MKILAKRRVFYDNNIIQIGQEVDYDGQSVPTWAIEVKNNDKYVQNQLPLDTISTQDLQNIKTNNSKILEKENQQNTDEILKELDDLITKGAEHEIILEDIENKSVQAQIDELKEKLKEV